MLLRWGLSFSIYGTAEILGAYVDPPDRVVNTQRAVTTAGLGAFADAFILRAFHMSIDRRIPSPVMRTLCDQLMMSPMYNIGYLTIARGTKWNVQDFWELYRRDCLFWPFASYLGYRFISANHRYLYVSGATLFWSTYRASLVRDDG